MKRIIIILFIICIMGNVYSQVEETCFVTYMKEIQKAQGSYDYSKVIDICDKYLKGECFKQESEEKHQIIKNYKEQAEKELKKEIDKEKASKNNAVTIKTDEVGNEIFTVDGIEFKMIKVEGGTFTMGATSEQGSDAYGDEKPTHSVTLSSYYIGETEVTQALWKAVMGNNPSLFKGDNLPVETVSYEDIQEFITKLNQKTGKTFRLPTEAEWEYAARGGKKSKGYKYSGSDTIYKVAWYEENSNYETHKVKTKQANELGLYDMSGNVREWCSDWYGDYSSSSQTNPKGPNSGSSRVLRGGYWNNSARSCRVSYRYSFYPSGGGIDHGFRLALAR